MDVFKSVDMAIKANIYEDGKATSRTFWTSEGERKTAGVLLPGKYTFSTETAERMEITSGIVEIEIAGSGESARHKEGEFFELPAGVSFEIRCAGIAEYVCSYMK